MNKFFLLVSFSFASLFGSTSLETYFTYLEKLDCQNGKYTLGEIEVVTDPAKIQEVSELQEKKLLQKGFSKEDAKEYSRIGILQEDQYIVWVRDAVYFPKKIPGTYDRIIWKNEGHAKACGVAVLPLLPSESVLLNLNYRHATRSWEVELPRGQIFPNETVQEAALREVKEETGANTSELIFLGTMSPDSGILSAIVPVFLGKVSSRGEATPEESEAIAGTVELTLLELREGLINGFVNVMINGVDTRVPLRDSYLTFALLKADLKKVLDFKKD